MGRPAPMSKDTASGSGNTSSVEAATAVANPPSTGIAATRSPALKPEPSGASRTVPATSLPSEEGQVGLHLVLAAGQQQVGEDDAGRLHVDEHLAVADRGLVDLGDLHRVRPVEPDDLYRAHRDLPFRPTGPSAVTVLQERGGDVEVKR